MIRNPHINLRSFFLKSAECSDMFQRLSIPFVTAAAAVWCAGVLG